MVEYVNMRKCRGKVHEYIIKHLEKKNIVSVPYLICFK